MKCKHCYTEFNDSKGVFANHVRWCDKNPKFEQFRKDNSTRGKILSNERFGEYKQFKVTCYTCESLFSVNEREILFPSKEVYFCSRKCANTIGGKAKAAKYNTDDVAHYTTIAWRYHKKECIICKEALIVAVHHMNENHNDNTPENLVPLCPTHHQYMHSKYKHLIIEKVTDYIHRDK